MLTMVMMCYGRKEKEKKMATSLCEQIYEKLSLTLTHTHTHTLT
jgi:hypothetical protein